VGDQPGNYHNNPEDSVLEQDEYSRGGEEWSNVQQRLLVNEGTELEDLDALFKLP
jgi:hypothetical protein